MATRFKDIWKLHFKTTTNSLLILSKSDFELEYEKEH